jgi:hypothetical protein
MLWKLQTGGNYYIKHWLNKLKTKNMSYISVDVESDGPIQGIHSMVSFGAAIVEPSLDVGARSNEVLVVLRDG